MLHTIRLRGPWQMQPVERRVAAPEGGRRIPAVDLPPGSIVEMPVDWSTALGPGFQGTVSFARRFNRPTGLDGGARVWLVIESAGAMAEVMLNGVSCGRASQFPARHDITAHLADHNRLAIAVTWPPHDAQNPPAGSPDQRGGWLGPVRLEIDDSALGA